ncbi:hypothetical protein ABZ565_12385 [Streptomyces sp. NPDC016469]|uniref:hypothetical protein n=1 Tax=Streptomyces sp. NPDC016469 TaxID=3157191 RepID=UPI00340569B6
MIDFKSQRLPLPLARVSALCARVDHPRTYQLSAQPFAGNPAVVRVTESKGVSSRSRGAAAWRCAHEVGCVDAESGDAAADMRVMSAHRIDAEAAHDLRHAR